MGIAGAVAVRGRTAPTRQATTVRPMAPVQPVVAPALGNRALGSILGGLTVQRSSCGGACGCGGTCGGEKEEPAAAPVQRLASVPTAASPAAMRSTVGALQSGAGNAAVVRLLAKQSTPRPVQRLGVEDLLPDWITGAIFGAKDKAAAGATKAQKDGEDAEKKADKEADTAVAKVDAATPKLAKEAAETASKAEQQMAGGNTTVAKGKAEVDAAQAKAAKEMAAAAAKTEKANEGKQLLQGEQPSCSVSKIMNSVEKVADIVGKPFGIKGGELLNRAGKLVSRIGKNIGDGLKAIAKFAKGAKDAYNAADTWVKGKLGVDIATIGKWALILTNPILAMTELGKFVFGKIVDGAVWAGKQLGALASYAMKEGPALLNSIKSKVGGWFNKLPSPLISAVQAIAAPFLGIAGPLLAAGKAIGDRLKPKADKAKTAADQAIADAKKKKDEIEAKAKADKAKKEGELAAKKSAGAAKTDADGKAAADAPKKEGDKKAAALESGAKVEADKLSHKVCAELDASAGQCIKDYLPDPGGKGNASSISGVVTGEVTIPIPETPISAKVGGGAKVEVSRTGAKSYTVAITGDAMLYANLGVGEASGVDVKVDMPGGGHGNVSKVWEKLGGAAKAPAASGPQAKADLDMGYRAQTALVYGFTAGETNCKGLGGLVTLLGVLGIKGGGGFLGELAMLGAQEAFEDNLQSRKFTIAQGVVMSGEVKNQFGKAGIKVGGEAGVTASSDKDEKTGKMVETIELFAGVSGEGKLEFDHDIIAGIGGGVAGAGKVSVVLGYVLDPATNTEEIKVIKLKGDASVTASVAACNLNRIGDVIGPAGLAKIRELLKIDKTTLDPTMASLTGAVAGEVDAGVAKAALGDLLSNPEATSVEAVKAKAKQVLAHKDTKGSASLTMTLTERLAGANVEAEQRKPGMNTGAKAAATLDRTETRLIWSTP